MKGRGHHDNKHIRRGGVGENKEDGGVVIVYRRLLRASESNTELWYTNSTNLHFLSNYQASRKYIKYIKIYIVYHLGNIANI